MNTNSGISYAEKAAKKGPLGEEIAVDEQQVNEDLREAKAKIVDKLDSAKEKAHLALENVDKEDIHRKIDDAENAIIKFIKSIGSGFSHYANLTAKKAGSATCTAKEELKNPVVASQAIIATGALIGGIYAYQERFRLKKIPYVVLCFYSLVFTSLLLFDGITFKKLYPQYKKK